MLMKCALLMVLPAALLMTLLFTCAGRIGPIPVLFRTVIARVVTLSNDTEFRGSQPADALAFS